ncbi:FG-GAP-like repeat-containing protein [uncultured Microbulbifer sp.]|uniref:PKD domain-containing protein n=1 Tax=uncultured Microbulbifer sp. TaxID=348147 RepID=UPI0026293338|nr:FG-GAP-like repeat-containing protein [uncultured Microbulbifer sp.]
MKLRLLAKYLGLSSAAFLFTNTASGEVQFQPVEIYSSGSKAEAVAIADFNNDGLDDVVLTTSSNFDPENDFKLKVFLQDEFGGLAGSIDYPLTGGETSLPQSIAVGDLDNNSLIDVIVGLDSGVTEIYLQDPVDGLVYAESLENSYSERVAIADLSNNSNKGILGVSWEENGAVITHKVGGSPTYVSTASDLAIESLGQMALGDVDGDGITDISLIANGAPENSLVVLSPDDSLRLNEITSIELDGNADDIQIKGIAIGDLNNDGRNDISVSLVGEGRLNPGVAVYYQGEDGLLQQADIHNYGGIPGELLIKDIDNDGFADLVVLPVGGEFLSIYQQQDDGALALSEQIAIPGAMYTNPQSMASGDVNGDGIADIVIVNPSQGLVVLKGGSGHINQPPTAVAGENQTVEGNTAVLLDGTLSSDSDGSIEAYRWTQISGTSVILNDSSDGFASFTAPSEITGVVQELIFELEVEDDKGLKNTSKVTISVGVNLDPVLIVDLIMSAFTAGQEVTLSAGQSYDPDGTIVSYQWQQVSSGPRIELKELDDGSVTFIVPKIVAEPGVSYSALVFTIEIEDNGGAKVKQKRYFFVKVLTAPVVGSAFLIVDPGEEVLLQGWVGDNDGHIVDYRWRSLSDMDIELTALADGSASFLAPQIPEGTEVTLEFELEVEDNDGLTATGVFTVIVKRNIPPFIGISFQPLALPNTNITLDGSHSGDSDGFIVSKQWEQVSGPPVELMDANTLITNFKAPAEPAVLSFKLSVTDNRGVTLQSTVSIEVALVSPRVISTTQEVGPGENIILAPDIFWDAPGAHIVDYRWRSLSDRDVELTIHADGSASFIAPQNPGSEFTLEFELEVEDNNGQTATGVFTVIVEGNIPPFMVVAYGAVGGVKTNTISTLSGGASRDQDGTIVSQKWEQVSGPSVELIDADKLTAYFMTPAEPASLSFKFSITDDDGATTDTTITLDVEE